MIINHLADGSCHPRDNKNNQIMKKEYLKPEILVEEILVETMIATSDGQTEVAPGTGPGGEWANDRRGGWGDLWD